MAVAYRGKYTDGGAANPNGTFHFSLSGTGAQVDDVAIGVVYSRSSSKTVTSVSGCTQLQYTSTANGGMIFVCQRVLTATDIDTYGYFGTFTLNSVTNGTTGQTVIVFSGVDPTGPIRTSATPVSGSGTSPNPPSVSITSGDTVVAIYGEMDDDAGTHTAPTNYTLQPYWSTTSGTDGASGQAYRLAVAASSEDPAAFTLGNGGGTQYWYADTVALVPQPTTTATVTHARSTKSSFACEATVTSGITATVTHARTTKSSFGCSCTNTPPAVTATVTHGRTTKTSFANACSQGIVTGDGLKSEYLASLAKNGTLPGNNSDPTGTWTDLLAQSAGTLSGFAYTEASGWDGDGSASDPYRLVHAGTDDNVGCTYWNTAKDLIFSFEAWVDVTTLVATQSLVTEGSTVASGAYITLRMVYSSPNLYPSLAYYAKDGSTSKLIQNTGSTTCNSGIYHLVATSDATNGRIYLNGTEITISGGNAHGFSTSQVDNIDTANLGARMRQTLGVFLTNGLIAARVYDRTLSAAEVASNYAAGPDARSRAITGAVTHARSTKSSFTCEATVTGGTAITATVTHARSTKSSFTLACRQGIITGSGLKLEFVGALAAKTGPHTNSDGDKATWYDLMATYDATLYSFAWTTASGWAGSGTEASPYCLVGDGSGDYANTAALPAPLSTQAWTAEHWVYRNGHPSGTAVTIDTTDTLGSQAGIGMIYWTDGTSQWVLGNGSSFNFAGSATKDVCDGQWHHCVCTFNGTSYQTYIDGATAGGLTDAYLAPDSTTLHLFRASRTPETYPNACSIAAVRTYNRVLDGTEVASNYGAGPQAQSRAITATVSHARSTKSSFGCSCTVGAQPVTATVTHARTTKTTFANSATATLLLTVSHARATKSSFANAVTATLRLAVTHARTTKSSFGNAATATLLLAITHGRTAKTTFGNAANATLAVTVTHARATKSSFGCSCTNTPPAVTATMTHSRSTKSSFACVATVGSVPAITADVTHARSGKATFSCTGTLTFTATTTHARATKTTFGCAATVLNPITATVSFVRTTAQKASFGCGVTATLRLAVTHSRATKTSFASAGTVAYTGTVTHARTHASTFACAGTVVQPPVTATVTHSRAGKASFTLACTNLSGIVATVSFTSARSTFTATTFPLVDVTMAVGAVSADWHARISPAEWAVGTITTDWTGGQLHVGTQPVWERTGRR